MALITYTNKVENGGTTAAGRFSAADANSIKTVVNANTPYKTLRGLLTQNGTDAPVLTILQNDTGLTFTTVRSGSGIYRVNFSTNYDPIKTFVSVGSNQSSFVRYLISTESYQGGYIVVRTFDQLGNSATDGGMLNTALEVLIYP